MKGNSNLFEKEFKPVMTLGLRRTQKEEFVFIILIGVTGFIAEVIA